MVHPLIGIHAFLGELGILAFVWIVAELLNPTPKRIQRAKIAGILAVLFFFISWAAGGYYYVNYYGPDVKPLIKEGQTPWVHSVLMETKEHVFLFIPFLSLLCLGLIFKYSKTNEKKTRDAILLLSLFIILLGFAMAGMGYLISNAARQALEVKVL